MQIVGNSEIYFTIFIYFYHYIVALRCVACKQAAWDLVRFVEIVLYFGFSWNIIIEDREAGIKDKGLQKIGNKINRL